MIHASGSSRFQRIYHAAEKGEDGPPMDLRFLKRPHSRMVGETATARVTSYLESLYQSVAETLPDVRDRSVDLKWKPCEEQSDAYAETLVDGPGKPSNKKVRKRKMGLTLHPERANDPALEVRYLPPGTMRDHWETMRHADDRERVSFKTFWKTWHVEFSHLRFRASTSRAQCATCMRHRLLIRSLSGHLLARQKQSEMYAAHLAQQYRDRQVYWAMRGSSRLRSAINVLLIVDGMDQCKFMYPRSPVMQSKDLCTFQRPKLQVTGCILHGYCLLFTVSNFDQAKDSSASADIVMHMLTRLHHSGVRLEDVHFHLQADNTTREIKNNTLLRLLAALVSHRRSANNSPFVCCSLEQVFYLLVLGAYYFS